MRMSPDIERLLRPATSCATLPPIECPIRMYFVVPVVSRRWRTASTSEAKYAIE